MIIIRRYLLSLSVVLAGGFCWQPVYAQPKPGYLPSSTHIFPAGARRGTAVRVRVGTECAPPGTRFLLAGDGVQAPPLLGEELEPNGEPSALRLPTETPITYPREWASEITVDTVDADAPLGPVFWRLSCAQGGTASRPFVIGELPEFIETESNSTFEAAERITLPVTVNGRINGERDADYFRFVARAGETVVCEVLAGRLGSRLDPVVEILNASGERIDYRRSHVGSDPVLAFRAEREGEYVLRIANVTMHGDPAHVYRINVSTKPFIRFAFPAGGQAGSEREVEFSVLSGDEVPRVIKRKVRFPAEKPGFSEQPGFWTDETGMRFDVNGHANLLEREPNDAAAMAMKLSLPVTIDGRTLTEGDEDWYEFTAEEGQRLAIRCRAFPEGGAGLPTLLLTDSAGNEIQSVLSVETPQRECRLDWKALTAGTYRLRVRDLGYGARGGPDFIYRLTVTPAEPDFALAVGSDGLNIAQGDDCKVEIAVDRSGGFEGPIELSVDGLPEGVTVEKTTVPAKAGKFTLTLNSDAEKTVSADSTLHVKGTAKINGQSVTRTVVAKHLGIDSEGIALGSDSLDRLHLTVQHKPVFRLFCSEAYLYAHRGSVFMYPMEIERLDGFDGEITVQIGDRQNRDLDGIEMFEVTIPGDESEFFLPIYLPETMAINVQSQSQLYAQAHATFVDKHGQTQSVLVLSEKRNMIRTMPAVVKLEAGDEQVSCRSVGEVSCRLHLERTTNFPSAMELTLLEPGPESGFSMEPVQIAAGQSEVQVSVRVDAQQLAAETVPLRFRGRGRMEDGTVVMTEAEVPFRLE